MPAITDAILALARMNWKPTFWKTLDNASAPGGKIDMYLMVDDESGEGGRDSGTHGDGDDDHSCD
jgi:hypothetical protein